MTFERVCKVLPFLTSLLGWRRKEEDFLPLKKKELRKEFHKLEEAMTNQKAAFFGGDSLSMIDYFMWPWFQWLSSLELNEYVAYTLSSG